METRKANSYTHDRRRRCVGISRDCKNFLFSYILEWWWTDIELGAVVVCNRADARRFSRGRVHYCFAAAYVSLFFYSLRTRDDE